jgi:hypothetical protein
MDAVSAVFHIYLFTIEKELVSKRKEEKDLVSMEEANVKKTCIKIATYGVQ